MDKKPIYVTQPYLPPLEEFNQYLQKIWDSKILTNNGQFHQELEKELCNYLGVKYISLFSNGTLALMTALQVLNISGEVITTPFSFVATTHALWWNKINPVFVDIESDTYNLDPKRIEEAITPQTSAILPVHVYGNPCDVATIGEIASSYGLKVIYDACHTFGAKFKGKAIASYGDLSVLSFHATKVFNTFEGGAIVCHDKQTKQNIDYLKNFGFSNEITIVAPGINAKMNEIEAAFGLLNLKYIDEAITKRKKIFDKYSYYLNGIPGIKIIHKSIDLDYNYSYLPIRIDPEKFGKSRDEVYNLLKQNGIFSRRYFYPLISEIPTYKNLSSASAKNLPIATGVSNEILCLPIYPDLDLIIVKEICTRLTALNQIK